MKKHRIVYGFCVVLLFAAIGFMSYKIHGREEKVSLNNSEVLAIIEYFDYIETIEGKFATGSRLPKDRLKTLSKIYDLSLGERGWISSVFVDTSGYVFLDPNSICVNDSNSFYDISILHGHQGYVVNLSYSKDSLWTAYREIASDRYIKAQNVIWK